MSTQTSTNSQLITLTIDGRSVTVPKGTTLYHAAKQLGIHIPIFCYQDRMPPFGACRMCLVEVEKMPKLQTACTLEVSEGMVVKTQSQMAVDGRKDIIEFLLINHPLDCPICDRGGECPLQDQALEHGPGASRFYEDKRHFKKALPLGPVLTLDRERCIVCARCTRFSDIVAGDNALEFKERGYKTEVGTPHEAPVDSKFIGNTIMICPVGALTSQVYRFKARPWDNKPTPTTCTLCPVGCSMILDERDGDIMRTRSRENASVNDIWLCDKGWFGYEFHNHPDRLTNPLIRRNGKLEVASWNEALDLIADKIKQYKPRKKLAGLGGDNLTVEESYLFQKLMREGCGVPHIDHRVGTSITSIEQEGLMPGMEMSLGDTEKLSYAVLLGLDLTEEFPVLWLRLKQAINKGAKTIFQGHFAPEISRHLSSTIVHTPGLELETLRSHLLEISAQLSLGGKAAIFIGRQYLDTPYRKHILAELLTLKKAHNNLSINIMEGRNNSLGARLAGMHPELLPQNQKAPVCGLDARQLLQKISREEWDLLYVAGANPFGSFSSEEAERIRSHLGFLVVQDLFLNETAQYADIVLPTASFIEKKGSFINIEGRLQKILPGKNCPEDIFTDGKIFEQLSLKLNLHLTLDASFTEFLNRAKIILRQADAINIGPVPTIDSSSHSIKAIFAKYLFDHGVRMRHNKHLVELAKKPCLRIHPQEAINRNIEEGKTIRLSRNGQSLSASVKYDSEVAPNTIVIPLGFEEIPAHKLSDNLIQGVSVNIEV